MSKITGIERKRAKITLGHEVGVRRKFSRFYENGPNETTYLFSNGDVSILSYDSNKIVWNRTDYPAELPPSPTKQELAYRQVALRNAAYVSTLPMRD